ncbi:hypothetical protein Dda_6142 [Drechslerella dactyloides]|uniref:Uncharacterized protein n=1 Tax=Drechslerella dactyloides TaxID=74499 RepID=A0AAD6IV92_DREDA|nr:hypothetical protein Dda_6142 [Drechslerella dactyloides]
MSGYYGRDGMGPPGPPPPPSQIPPRPAAYRQGAQQQDYYTQENSEAPAWRIPYHETEVLISTVETASTSPIRPHHSGNLSRSSSSRQPENQATHDSRKPENYAVDSAYHNYSTETTVLSDNRAPSHNMVVEDRGANDTEQVSDGMNEASTFLWGGPVNFYETSRPKYQAPTSQETAEHDRHNTGLRTIKQEPKPEPEPLEEKIAMDFSDYFMPSFHPASNPQLQSQPHAGQRSPPAPSASAPPATYPCGGFTYNNAPHPGPLNQYHDAPIPVASNQYSNAPPLHPNPYSYSQDPIPLNPYSDPPGPGGPNQYGNPPGPNQYSNAHRPVAPSHTLSDPFPISVEQERYSADLARLRESQFPEPVNLGGSDTFFQPPSHSYASYRRTPRRPEEDCGVKLDANGLPSLSGILGPGKAYQPPRRSFDATEEKRFYPNTYNNSSVSLLSTHSENIPPSSRYSNHDSKLHPTPSYASLRPDIDTRPCDSKPGIPPPPTRYYSQRAGGNKLAELAQERKMEFVVGEINRKDALHRAIQDESRRYGYQ